MNFKEADTMLQGRSKESRKLCNNTYLQRREDGSIAVRLHQTDVVTFNQDGSTVLISGGWRTVTTKDRINSYLPFGQIWSTRGEWGYWRNGKRIADYCDGIRIGPRGGISKGASKRELKDRKELKASIRSYALLCSESIPLGMPDNGDCFYCHMVTDGGQSLGDATKDTSHLTSHMEEGYVVPSLVWKALEEAGYDPQVQILHSLVFDNSEGYQKELAQDVVKKVVVKFMARRFGI